MPTKRDYYEVLGLSRDASDQDVKKAYRRLAREHHPDANPGDKSAEERFKELTEAYEVLSNAESRRAYDTYGHQVPSGAGGGGYSGGADPFGGFQDIFETFFGDRFGADPFSSGGRGRAASCGADAEADIEIDLREAAFGVERDIKVQTVKNCRVCDGVGGTESHTCPTCGGTGVTQSVRESILGQMISRQPCSSCRGNGRVVDVACENCRGSGRISDVVTKTLQVPSGVEDGMRLRVSGSGHEGESGAPPGDLYVNIKVKEDPDLMRDGDDLIHRVRVSFVDAALGTEAKVPTLDGDREVQVEAGTQPGATLRRSGEGMPRLRRRGRGDLKVVVDVMIPTRLNGEQRDLLEKFDAASGDETYNGSGSSFFERLRSVFK